MGKTKRQQRKRKKPRNPVARELRERGPRQQPIRNKRDELREQEAERELQDWKRR